MLHWLRQRWRTGAASHLLLAGVPAVAAAVALLNAAGLTPLAEPDADFDRMPDAYELFFGLDSSNSADAGLDYDGDELTNLEESKRLTDPFVGDTDRDGFDDNNDGCAVSRGYIQWGSPRFTTGDHYDYAHPAWFLGAYKHGGEWVVDAAATQTVWLTARSAWYVPAEESNGASLSIDLDRSILTNNLMYAVHYFDERAAALYVDLLDTNGVVVAEDLYGNLMGGSNEETVVHLAVPTALFPEAAVINLRRGAGNVLVYEGLVYIDEDGDGLDLEQENQLGISDRNRDSNRNGTNDYDEVFLYHTDPALTNNVPDPDPGGDQPPAPRKKGVVYVDQARGNDSFTGRASDISGQDGPKKTIQNGLVAVDADHAAKMVIKSGAYRENLDIRGRKVTVFIEGNVKL